MKLCFTGFNYLGRSMYESARIGENAAKRYSQLFDALHNPTATVRSERVDGIDHMLNQFQICLFLDSIEEDIDHLRIQI